jgi:predicted PhzF superfamily epimerase YddE/YHI9
MPGGEIDLCGHATLASAFVLLNELHPERDRVDFVGKTGPLAVTRDLFALLEDEASVRNLKPDLDAISRLEPALIVVTAPGSNCDFVSRCFAPKMGVPEDPVTGSSHCVLVPYWAERLGKRDLHARQLSKRGGELFCKLRGDRVMIAGKAVKVIEGSLFL